MPESVDFVLADGVRVEVYWVNGPPYLSVVYRKAMRGVEPSKGPAEMRLSQAQQDKFQKQRAETLCKDGHDFSDLTHLHMGRRCSRCGAWNISQP